MKTSFLRILIIICALVWSLGAQAQKSIDLINDNYDASNDEVFHSSGHMPSQRRSFSFKWSHAFFPWW